MVSVVVNPHAVWSRLLVETGRLVNWARRNGTDEQKEAVRKALDTLNELAPYFDFVPNPPNLAASLNKPIEKAGQSPHANVRYASALDEGFIAYQRGVNYDDCPRMADHDAQQWREGWMLARAKFDPESK